VKTVTKSKIACGEMLNAKYTPSFSGKKMFPQSLFSLKDVITEKQTIKKQSFLRKVSFLHKFRTCLKKNMINKFLVRKTKIDMKF
jgi:hypothetical protein